MRANRGGDLEFSLVTGATPFRGLGQKHPHGWGVGWYDRATPSVKKEPLPAHESRAVTKAATEVDSEIVIAHVRYATCGDLKPENCHPFCFGNWLFAHNGGLHRGSLLEQLDDGHRASLQGETDSEVLFHWLLQNIEREGNVLAGLRTSLSTLQDVTGLNFLLSDGKTLYAFRDAAERHNYYSLYFLARDPLDSQLERFQSTEVGTLLHGKALRGEKAVLVCSERLTSEDWKPLEMGHLLIVPESLVPTSVKVR
jgi:glutamine amidotransferase